MRQVSLRCLRVVSIVMMMTLILSMIGGIPTQPVFAASLGQEEQPTPTETQPFPNPLDADVPQSISTDVSPAPQIELQTPTSTFTPIPTEISTSVQTETSTIAPSEIIIPSPTETNTIAPSEINLLGTVETEIPTATPTEGLASAPIRAEPVVNATPAIPLCGTQSQISVEECNALVALYNSTNGDGWSNKSGWLVDETPCDTWVGVSCDGGYVSVLNLGGNQLNGTIPSELGNLTNLTNLNLGWNQFTEIPSEIGILSSLTSLDLSGNQGVANFVEQRIQTHVRDVWDGVVYAIALS